MKNNHRAWDPESKIMLTAFWVGSVDGEVWVADGQVDVGVANIKRREGLIIMRALGIPDKDGTEIYKGDILNIDTLTGSVGLKAGYVFNDLKVAVEWDNENALWSFNWKDYDRYSNYFDRDDEYEAVNFRNQVRALMFGGRDSKVVGNIYENPELVETK